MGEALQAPFPWFGGKSRVADLVWDRFGAVANYVEPFAGSLAVLLGRPQPFAGIETVNDKDGLLCNFWRALQHDPEAVAHHADWPVNENDLHARHAWLVGIRDSFVARLEGDPDYYDPKIAGWWVWGICCWIGGEWCSGKGPWQVVEAEDGSRQLVHLGDAGRGVKRKLAHLGNAGQGVNRQRVHLGNAGQGVQRSAHDGLFSWFLALAERLQRVRVCCGDWTRVCGPSPTFSHGCSAVFLDPPYSAEAGRENAIYREEDLTVAHAVRKWCLANGGNPLLRIALCGYEGEHQMPASWECVAWKAAGGYANQGDSQGKANTFRERIWFSPHCLRPAPGLFDHLECST